MLLTAIKEYVEPPGAGVVKRAGLEASINQSIIISLGSSGLSLDDQSTAGLVDIRRFTREYIIFEYIYII